MSRLSKHLRPNELVVWSASPAMTPFIFNRSLLLAFIAGIFIVVVAFIPFYPGTNINWGVGGEQLPIEVQFAVTLFVVLFGFLIGFAPLIIQFFRCRKIEYMITNRRMIVQTGFAGRDTQFLDLDKIMDVYVHVSAVDKMFGTGTVGASSEAGFFKRYPMYAFRFSDPFWRSTRATVMGKIQVPLYAFAVRDPFAVEKMLKEAIQNAREHADLSCFETKREATTK